MGSCFSNLRKEKEKEEDNRTMEDIMKPDENLRKLYENKEKLKKKYEERDIKRKESRGGPKSFARPSNIRQ